MISTGSNLNPYLGIPFKFCFYTSFTASCPIGDLYQEGSKTCFTCPNNTYTFDPPENNSSSCKECPTNAHCFGGRTIVPASGFYLFGNDSTTPVRCLSPEQCLGGIKEGSVKLSHNGYCAENFEDAMCSNC